ncbi:MAG: SUMF1/EgtB/PvdO family nonheme iron enzyme [Chloroflexi bacterium]|nr:SUMF1/EgtB/PvdO family nonheme iron enzyme [Chloroflexota bacterium]MBP8056708.1 SUMF1/EgtB/PvdO family nonheme iron enzyme [Chloroflexota bacterium]
MSSPFGSHRSFSPGDIIGGRYRLESLLGQGGMSSVYKASDPNLKRTVAIKVIHPHLSQDPAFFGRFEQEAAAVAQLRHPHIYQVHDFNQDNGTYYMIMEYVEGVTLEARLKALNNAAQRMTLREATHLMIAICEAVDYAHQRGLIHRDLKPSNVMLNPEGEPVLMDFGIARLLGGQNFTATGATIGTAAYMSPEQARNTQIDHRTDIYALGVMLYEMVSGRRPFDGDSFVSVLLQHVNDPVPDIREINHNVPLSLVQIIEKALQKNATQRFNSAAEFAMALRSVSIGTSQPMHSLSGMSPALKTDSTMVMTPFTTPQGALRPQTGPAPTIIGSSMSTGQNQVAPPKKRRWGLWLLLGAAAFLFLGVILIAGLVFSLTNNRAANTTTAGMTQIPAGTYTVGTEGNSDTYAPSQQISLDSYWIDKREVTNAQYAEFLADTEDDAPSSWSGNSFPTGQEDYPVQGISLEMAEDYCDWQGKRLPTEAEWEVAARGHDSFLYPWGNTANAVSLPRSSTYPVGTISQNRSPFGVYDMAGNVWEWVDEPYTELPDGQALLRGGQYGLMRDMAYRLTGDPTTPSLYAAAGIRCAVDPDEVTVVPDETIFFADDFTNLESGWPTNTTENGLIGYHAPDDYHIEVFVPDAVTTVFRNPSQNDYTLEVKVRVDHTDTPNDKFRYGVAFRRQGDNFYAFTLSPLSGEWQVFRQDGDSQELLDSGTNGTMRGLTENDTLRVDVSGDRFVFQLNNEIIAQVRDTHYSRGELGFYVETFSQTLAHIHYDHILVREVEILPDPSLLLSEGFTDPQSGWPSVEEATGFVGYHPPDYYHVEVSATATEELVSPGLFYDDIAVEVLVFVDHTDTTSGDFWYGLVARREGENYYLFAVSPRARRWQISRHDTGGFTPLAEGASEAITPDLGENTLLVETVGSFLAFTVNGTALTTIRDDSLTQGDIGFYVATLDESLAHVHYDELMVRRLTEGEVQPVAAATPSPAPLIPTATTEHDHTPEPTAEPSPIPTGPAANPANMVRVVAGPYPIGAEQVAELPTFWIDAYEVSNSQYADFVTATDTTPPTDWVEGIYPEGRAAHPVQGITWDDAAAYCAWVDKRLPSEAEWEAAARGPQGWPYPWGDNAAAVLLPNSDTYVVGSLLANRSFAGAYDMAGNVWEWVDTPHTPIPEGQRVLHGGANNFQNDLLFRAVGDPTSTIMFANAGIRCATDHVTDDRDTTVLLQDEFADINSGWWQARQPIGPYFYGYHPTDFYHMQVRGADSCLFVDKAVPSTNYVAQIDTFVAATETETGNFRYGLAFRITDNRYYALVISPLTQMWQVLRSEPGGIVLLAEGAVTTLRGREAGQTDRLVVTANGAEFTLFVNGELVAQLVDDTYADGHIGFYTGTLDQPYIHIHFDTVTAWALPTNAPVPTTTTTSTDYPRTADLCSGSVSAEDTLASFFTHTVATGETLSAIADQYGLTQEAILGANGRAIGDANLIRVGQTIIIPQ